MFPLLKITYICLQFSMSCFSYEEESLYKHKDLYTAGDCILQGRYLSTLYDMGRSVCIQSWLYVVWLVV